ncbi:MAG TPA: DUF4349 domain-containing protein [Terracidiphilus sp.]
MSKYSHPVEPEELMAYLDGELSKDRAMAAVAHLERCPECQVLAADLRGVSQRLMAWQVESPTSQMSPEIIAALEQPVQPAKTIPAKPVTWRTGFMERRWVLAGGFAAFCIAAGLALKWAGSFESRSVPAAGDLAAPGSVVFREPVSRQKSRIVSQGAAPSAGTIDGGQVDRLEQFSVLQNPSPAKPPDSAPVSGPMIIRTAALTLTTKDFDKARASLDDVLRRHHGYLGDLNVSTPVGSGRTLTATLRIPADQLDAVLADLKKLGRPESESQGGQDVTAQYVDLQARLSNERNAEVRLTNILEHRTGTLGDVLAVENEVSRVRGEIERMEAERKTLSNQVNFATINTTVNEDYQAQLQVVPTSTLGRIHNAAVDGYRSMVEGVIGSVLFLFSFGPSLLFWCAIFFFPARFVWKRVRREKSVGI